MARELGGLSFEGRYFILQIPDDWRETDPLPVAGPNDRWFDDRSAFKAALRGPWIWRPVRRLPWQV